MGAARQAPTFRADWLNHAQAHPITAAGLGLTVPAVAWVLPDSAAHVPAGYASVALSHGLPGGLEGASPS